MGTEASAPDNMRFHEIDGPEAGDRYLSSDGEKSEELDRLVAERPESVENGHKTYAFLTGNEVVTDYLVVVE
ncbi:hypothetical protein [Microlunatus ginsengisoli]|uniref:Uncharacterized protein n=1 Tax=Microlunatus ginsengisoli TaxID=363863 RepID=A0ABP6ZB06_9ACTN